MRMTEFHFTFSHFGEQGWRSGESARLPPMWPGFKSRRRRHMWVEFVVGSLPCSERFFSGYSGFPLSPKTNTSKFQFDLERTDTEKRALELLGASWVNKLQLHFYISHPLQRVKRDYKLQSAQNYFFINYVN